MREQILAVQRMQDYIEKNKTEEISLSALSMSITASLSGKVKDYRGICSDIMEVSYEN